MKDFEHGERLLDLFEAHRFDDFLALHREVRDQIPKECADLYLADVTYALMALGRHAEALESAREWHRSGERTPVFARDLARGMAEIGACQWMLGDQAAAIGTWRHLCDGTRSGLFDFARCPYGGFGIGLLLWAGAAIAGDPASLQHARTYLQNRLDRVAKMQVGNPWPISAARWLLAEYTASDLVAACLEQAEFLPGPRRISPNSEQGRRRLCEAYFVAGASEWMAGRETEARAFYAQAGAIENPLSIVEWYLARYELARSTPTPADSASCRTRRARAAIVRSARRVFRSGS